MPKKLKQPSLVYGPPLEEETAVRTMTIPGYLRDVTARYGAAEALVMRDGAERLSWTYDELWAQSARMAAALIAHGVTKDTRVGILMTNRPEFLSSLFGIAMAGGVAVAFSTFSTPTELGHLLKVSDVSILLFEERVLKHDFRGVLCELEPSIETSAPGTLSSPTFPYLSKLVSVGDERADSGAIEQWEAFLASGSDVADEIVEARANAVTASDTGGIFFSSGTTSLPKGIVHSQRAFAIQWQRWPRVFTLNEPVRSWTGNGFFWSGNISMIVGTALSTGGAMVLQRYFNETDALALLEKERVSFANGRPHQWARLQSADNWSSTDLSSLKYVTRGDIIREHPSVDTAWREPSTFGTTETMTIVTSALDDPPEAIAEGSFGAPMPGNILKIVDPAANTIVPRGTSGEFCIKGPTLMNRYLGKNPEDCFDDDGFFRTGDGGRVDDEGRFYWEGRLTDMIKTGGANVAPDEVDLIINNFPGVKRSQTVGVPDALLGERVVSCIVPLDGSVIDESSLRAQLKEQLASFKIPRDILVFEEREFSLTGNEKPKVSDIRTRAVEKLSAQN